MSTIAHISCLYDDVDPSTYEGISISMSLGAEAEVFNTGKPFHDYLTGSIVIFHRAGEDAIVMGASSIDHFAMDGGDLPDGTEATEEQVMAAAMAAKAYLIQRGEVEDDG